MIASELHRRGDLSFEDCFVDCLRNAHAALTVGVKDTRLRAHNKIIPSRVFDPFNIIMELSSYLNRCALVQPMQHLERQLVCKRKVGGRSGRAYPPEWSESVIK